MLFSKRFKETHDRADFYFDTEEKVFTKEYSSEYIAISVIGEFASDDYVRSAFTILESHSFRGLFDSCNSFEDLAAINV